MRRNVTGTEKQGKYKINEGWRNVCLGFELGEKELGGTAQ
jgi:hypothetical protein